MRPEKTQAPGPVELDPVFWAPFILWIPFCVQATQCLPLTGGDAASSG